MLNSRIYIIFIGLFSLLMVAACSAPTQPATPKETFETYSKAVKKNDITTMKLLLSNETIKLHEQEAKVQRVTLDEIVKREALLNQSQTIVKVRNEKIEGEKATLEVENSIGIWETVLFVFEDGVWKIDKKTTIDLMRDIEDINNKQLDDLINSGRVDPANVNSMPDVTPPPIETKTEASPTPVEIKVQGATPTPVVPQ